MPHIKFFTVKEYYLPRLLPANFPTNTRLLNANDHSIFSGGAPWRVFIQSAVNPNHQNSVANSENGQHTTLSAWTRNDSHEVPLPALSQWSTSGTIHARPARFWFTIEDAKTWWRQIRSAVPQPAIYVQIIHFISLCYQDWAPHKSLGNAVSSLFLPRVRTIALERQDRKRFEEKWRNSSLDMHSNPSPVFSPRPFGAVWCPSQRMLLQIT